MNALVFAHAPLVLVFVRVRGFVELTAENQPSRATVACVGASRKASVGPMRALLLAWVGLTSCSLACACSSKSSTGTPTSTGSTSSSSGATFACNASFVCSEFSDVTASELPTLKSNCVAETGVAGTSCPKTGALGSCSLSKVEAGAQQAVETFYEGGTFTACSAQHDCLAQGGTFTKIAPLPDGGCGDQGTGGSGAGVGGASGAGGSGTGGTSGH